jgi:RNA polymerase sigma-70 factor (ECF subfamily)
VTRNADLLAALEAARAGDLRAFRVLVEATHEMAYAVAWQVLRRGPEARDAVQEAYLRAFERLASLGDPEAFPGWLRRIVVATALNQQRRSRTAWVTYDERTAPPVLDADERRWTPAQERLLARAIVSLSAEERRLVELHYHAGWTAERLARAEAIEPAAMRKRLQRIREKLRKEIEMDEKHAVLATPNRGALPNEIVELLARPRLVDLPENPVSAVTSTLRSLRGVRADRAARGDRPRRGSSEARGRRGLPRSRRAALDRGRAGPSLRPELAASPDREVVRRPRERHRRREGLPP